MSFTTPEQRTANVQSEPWKPEEDEMLAIYFGGKLPDAAIRTITELTGRSAGAIRQRFLILRNRRDGILPKKKREKLAAQQQDSSTTAAQAIPEVNIEQPCAIPVLEVNQAQKELMDSICTIIHMVNGKQFILKVV